MKNNLDTTAQYKTPRSNTKLCETLVSFEDDIILLSSLKELTYIRLYELITHRDIWTPFKKLMLTQWLSQEEIKRIQFIKLKYLLKHAYSKVSYYKRKFRDSQIDVEKIHSLDDLEKIPLLTKNDLRRFYPIQLIARQYNHWGGFEDATGGTIGGPTRYYIGPVAAGYRAANATRNQHWYQFSYGDSNALIWGALRDLETENIVKRKILHLVMNRVELNAWKMSRENMRQFAEELSKKKPNVLVGYSGAVSVFAKFVLEEGFDIYFPSGIVVSGESITELQRDTIKSAFQSAIYDRYGTREFGAIAHECPAHNGLHINAESIIIEQGRQIGNGNSLIITDLNNYSMPFIRYEIGDSGILGTHRCECGRGLPILEKIEGRITDFILTEEGTYVNGIIFPHIIRKYPEISEFKVVQKDLSYIELHVVLKDSLSSKKAALIRSEFKEFIGNMRIEIIEADKIPKSRSGKSVLVHSHISM
jgi:phenylacetate-CoA ligase